MKHIFRLILFLLILALPLLAAADTTLTFPAGLTRIEDETFFGCTDVEKAVLHEGVTHIGARAFAGSGLKEITLPASLVFIADDAFEGCPEGLTVHVPEDTYAWEWAAVRGYLGTGLLKVIIDLPSGWTQIDVTESFQIPYHTIPADASEKPRWTSLHPDIGIVDENGLVTPLKAGYLNIQVTKSNGMYLGGANLLVTGEFYSAEDLEYELTADGAGYRVVGCTGDPGRITIPATHNGLPVVGFEPGAFKNCTHLTDIVLEEGHTVLYMENAALYANLPEKTLLCYPGSHIINRYYLVSASTQAIAAYAFSHSYLRNLTIPEGVVSIGDCAFYKLQNQMMIYMPDSLTDFGSSLLQGQQHNASFYVKSWDSPAYKYAQKYNIPCGIISTRTPEPTMVPTPTPAPEPTPDIPPVDDENIVVHSELYWTSYQNGFFKCLYDISALEGDDVSEVRLAIKDQWKDLVYYPELSQQTGLYGAGYTGQKAILRAYNQYGAQIGAKEISGNFTFSFDGARTLGVSGGKDTKLMVVPTKPIFITSPGRYPIQPSQWRNFFDGDIYQHYIIAMPRGMMHFDFPDHLNILAYQNVYCTTDRSPEEYATPLTDYIFCLLYTQDASQASQMDQVTMVFDTLECLLNNDSLVIYAASLPDKSPNLGESIGKVFESTRAEMLSGHYPSSQSVKKVRVYIDGSYPGASMSTVWLDDQFYEYDENDVCTLSHEFVHAIDQGLRDWTGGPGPVPSAWMEGRAEYISKDICAKLGVPYTSNDYSDGKDYNWSFLSEIDRTDFFHFYFHSTNRNTTYTVGYYFYDFLIDTYGSNVGARVMQNIATLPYNGEREAFFKQCVEAATEEGVFQRFVNDVIIPSGT